MGRYYLLSLCRVHCPWKSRVTELHMVRRPTFPSAMLRSAGMHACVRACIGGLNSTVSP